MKKELPKARERRKRKRRLHFGEKGSNMP